MPVDAWTDARGVATQAAASSCTVAAGTPVTAAVAVAG